jgi:protein-L-isoaspartate(D-aspartate) O-methyltransferase
MPSIADQANDQMVNRLIAEGALWSKALTTSFRATPRHAFLDRVFHFSRKQERWREIIVRDPGLEELRLLYSDKALITRLARPGPGLPPVPISSSSQPSLMAEMLEDLKLEAGQRILEVGAGTGYNAALMAGVVGAGLVTSVDVDAEVVSEAWDHLRKFPDRQVRIQHADGRAGFGEAAPFDRIMVTAAADDLEAAWLEQLAPRGLLLAPLALAPGLAFIVRGAMVEDVFHGRLTRAAYFMPLRAEGETGSGETVPPLPAGDLQSFRAPWIGWFERRKRRATWLSFIQSLAFFGYLKHLAIHYRLVDEGSPSFGVSQESALCWFSPREWQVNSETGRELGLQLWRAFLEAGGPWPTEYRLLAGFSVQPEAGRRQSFRFEGPRTHQLWEITEPRDRPGWF